MIGVMTVNLPPPPPQRSDNYIIVVWKKVLPKNTLILDQVQWSLSLLMVSVLRFSCLLMNLKLNNGQKNSMQSAKKNEPKKFYRQDQCNNYSRVPNNGSFLNFGYFLWAPDNSNCFRFSLKVQLKDQFHSRWCQLTSAPPPPHLREVE